MTDRLKLAQAWVNARTPTDLSCPTCGADPGKSCRDILDHRIQIPLEAPFHHAKRVDAAFEKLYSALERLGADEAEAKKVP